jgi:hypothetical protein
LKKLVVGRVDIDEGVDRVIDGFEILYAITAAGREHVTGPWKDRPIEWPSRATYVALPDGGIYRTQFRSLEPLAAALGNRFRMVHRGVLVNLDRVRFPSRGRPLMLGFAREGSDDRRDALWAKVAKHRKREIENALGWVRRAARDGAVVTRNDDELDGSWDLPEDAMHDRDGKRRDDDEGGE